MVANFTYLYIYRYIYMISGSVTFDLYSSDRFDCFAVRFQFSDIYFIPAGVGSLFLFFLFFFFLLQECSLCVCVGVHLFTQIKLC